MDDLKDLHLGIPDDSRAALEGYVIENKDGLKESKRGRYSKYASSGYTLAQAIAPLPVGDPFNHTDPLTRAFGVVIDTIDTNPYPIINNGIKIRNGRHPG